MEENRILVLGSISMGISMRIGHIPALWESVQASSALYETDGKASRVASAAARLGAGVSIIGKVGQDSFGDSIRSSLSSSGVDIRHVAAVPDKTGLIILLRTESRETSLVHDPGANLSYEEGEIARLEPFFAQHRILIVSNSIPLFSLREALQIAKKHRLLVMLDPSPASELPDDIYPLVDVLLPGEQDIKHLSHTEYIDLSASRLALSRYLELGVGKAAILKIGMDGVLIATNNEFIGLGTSDMTNEIDRRGDKAVFVAAMASAFAQHKNLYQAAVYARAAAQLSELQSGIRVTLPTSEALQAYLNENPLFKEIDLDR
ncbi:MAG TPA: PfkB family carbohydrate kinase [Feifaniaceae bacterium]|nr:PfkB family carbohydrate kinase [Feifaniaceae bacterium]